jgi:hypothetical protein
MQCPLMRHMMTTGEGKPAANSVLNRPLLSYTTETQICVAPMRNGLFAGSSSCWRELESRRVKWSAGI